MHFTFRAEAARGALSLLHPRHARLVQKTLAEQSQRWNVRVMEQANVGNHQHLVLKAANREGFRHFLRCVCGIIAMKVTGSCKGKPFGARFWDELAFSRVVEWGRDLLNLRKYLELNRLEANGYSRAEARAWQKNAQVPLGNSGGGGA